MKIFPYWVPYLLTVLLAFSHLNATDHALPDNMQKIMDQEKYEHAIWGIYAKDLQTGEILFDLNSTLFFSPASISKLFSTAALLHTFGYDHTFKTPVYADGKIEKGNLQGNLVLVGQGDFIMGGRQSDTNQVSFNKRDHITANAAPGAILTPEDPLQGINELAKQIYQSGIREITGNVLVDDRLFETVEKRGMALSPILINENLIDLVINPTAVGEKASIKWRPEVPGYTVSNQVITSAKGGDPLIEIESDHEGHRIVVKGTIPIDRKDVVNTFSIKDPNVFAREAFIQALKKQGVKFNKVKNPKMLPASYANLKQVASWTSLPLVEYAKLISKTSHNLGADLIPLLLAAHDGKKTFDEGMLILGDLLIKEVGLSPEEFVLFDAAGGNDNRLTPEVTVKLLEYLYKQPSADFQGYFYTLPILGVDGSLEDFAKNSAGSGRVRGKTGTGITTNFATGEFFLLTQGMAGYIEGKNGHLIAYMIVVNNGAMPTIQDVFPIFEDVAQLSSIIYDHTNENKDH
jgi:serine-type D-Ala-D-Ala carboxypeptidase/endopeptidase (penicillin-binding protein 4)